MLRSDTDRLTLARIAGVTQRHARFGPLTDVQEAAALAEIAEVAGARVDLLAEHAGLVLGWHEHDMNEPLYRRVAQLCIRAGADMALIDQWIEEGRRRSASATRAPRHGPGHSSY